MGLYLDDLTAVISAAIGAGMMGLLGRIALWATFNSSSLDLHMSAAFALPGV